MATQYFQSQRKCIKQNNNRGDVCNKAINAHSKSCKSAVQSSKHSARRKNRNNSHTNETKKIVKTIRH